MHIIAITWIHCEISRRCKYLAIYLKNCSFYILSIHLESKGVHQKKKSYSKIVIASYIINTQWLIYNLPYDVSKWLDYKEISDPFECSTKTENLDTLFSQIFIYCLREIKLSKIWYIFGSILGVIFVYSCFPQNIYDI